jgi:hypothetical protein
VGAWGSKIFENDDAADFVAAFEQEGVVAISRALDAACRPGSYIEAPEGSVALAAAAMVAAANGASGLLSEPAQSALNGVTNWQALTGLKGKARRAVDCVEGPSSELIELWDDAVADDAAGFRAELKRLRDALR